MDPIFPINEEILEEGHLDRGFPAYITDTEEYGWLVTAGTTVKVGDDIIGYAMVDVSMSVVRARQADQIVRLFIYMTVTIILICAVIFLIIYLSFIKPVKKITSIASSYDSENPAKSHDDFDKLEIKNHDELYDLTLSIKKMENDVNNKIIELTETNRRLVESQQFARKMTELANKDALTGVRNKIAYDGMVNVINEEISKGNPTPFGVIMVDLNYLKNINDDYGHDSGDTALIKLCNLICATFTHSPVFRVGGDEFVVIVRTVDYERVEKLINEFNTKIDELSHDDYLLPAEKISAAIGFSRFDKKTDKCVDDVFKRADKAMYERKRSMKHLD